MYDAAGQRVGVATTQYQAGYYDYDWGYYYEGSYYEGSYNELREIYLYDGAGRLYQTQQSYGAAVSESAGANNVPAAPGTGTLKSSFGYDLMGRATSQSDYDYNGYTVMYSRSASYNAKGQLIYDSTSTRKNDNKTYTTSTSYYYTDYSSGQYMLGSVAYVSTGSTVNGGNYTASLTRNSYAWRDGAVQTQIAYQPNTSQGTVYNTTFTLNALGQMTSAYIADGKPRSVSFTLDEIGQIIRRDESGYISGQTGNPHEIWYRFRAFFGRIESLGIPIVSIL
ncbi:MAG: hypothetical protein ACK519_00810 [Sphingomonadaceae bacterium]